MEKLDVVYILKNSGTRWRNQEIKYSIRSIEKHLDFNKIWIIGKLPVFLDGAKIGFIKSEDPFSNKLKNAVHKLTIACNNKEISDNFILMNDDFFFLKDVENIKYYNKGKLEKSEKNHSTKSGYYYKAIKKTLKMLNDMGVSNPTDFEIHYPIIINKEKFLKTMNNIKHCDVLFRSLYGNLNEIKSTYRSDVKIFDKSQFTRFKNKEDLISTDEKFVTDISFQKWIDKRFRDISYFEKIPKTGYYCDNLFSFNGKKYNPGEIIIDKIPEKVIEDAELKLIKVPFY